MHVLGRHTEPGTGETVRKQAQCQGQAVQEQQAAPARQATQEEPGVPAGRGTLGRRKGAKGLSGSDPRGCWENQDFCL